MSPIYSPGSWGSPKPMISPESGCTALPTLAPAWVLTRKHILLNENFNLPPPPPHPCWGTAHSDTATPSQAGNKKYKVTVESQEQALVPSLLPSSLQFVSVPGNPCCTHPPCPRKSQESFATLFKPLLKRSEPAPGS